MNPGDRVATDDGTGTIVSVWHELSWSFGIPRRTTWFTVEIDGPDHWRKVYNPRDVDLLDEIEFEIEEVDG